MSAYDIERLSRLIGMLPIDEDLGRSAANAAERPGFARRKSYPLRVGRSTESSPAPKPMPSSARHSSPT